MRISLIFVAVASLFVVSVHGGILSCDVASISGGGLTASSAIEYEGLCVGIYNKAGNWFNAQSDCASLGGWLWTPRSAGMNSLIANQASNGWIGVHDMTPTTEGNFVGDGWGDQKVSFFDWNSGEPNNVGNEDCVHLTSVGSTWNDLPCSHSLNEFMCEFPIIQNVDDEAACNALAGQDLVLDAQWSGDSCLIVPSNPKDWSGGDSYCSNFLRNGEAARLAKLDSAALNSLALSMNRNGGAWDDLSWFGGHDMAVEGEFVWTDGQEFSCGFTNWKAGEPNDSSGEDCVELQSNGEWNDRPCERYFGYICGWPSINSCYTTVFDDECKDVSVTEASETRITICFDPNGAACPP